MFDWLLKRFRSKQARETKGPVVVTQPKAKKVRAKVIRHGMSEGAFQLRKSRMRMARVSRAINRA